MGFVGCERSGVVGELGLEIDGSGNVARDRRHAAALRRLGWRVIVLWECEVRTAEAALAKVRKLRMVR